MNVPQQDLQDEASSQASTTGNTGISPDVMTGSPSRNTDTINRTASRISGHDAFQPAAMSEDTEDNRPYREAGDEVFDKVSRGRKIAIVAVLSFGAFLSPISSTSVLAATPEVAATYKTSGSIINLSNAAYMIIMALSPLFWGPMSQVYGRRIVSTVHTLQK